MIKLNHVHKEYISISNLLYNSERRVITAVSETSLDINFKDYISFVGNTGSGKTTLISMIGLLLKPSSGSITFNNRKINDLAPWQLNKLRARHFSYILQKTMFFDNMNIIDNILFPITLTRKVTDEDMDRAIHYLNILKFNNSLNDQVYNLSFGERKKCAIVRALMKKADILVADEPTASLDMESAAAAMELIKEKHKFGTAVVLVTHSKTYTKNSKNIYLLEKGEIKECLK